MNQTATEAAETLRPEQHKVYVNTEEKIVEGKFLTFQEVVKLAFPDGPFGDRIVYSVLYHYEHETQEYTLDKGQKVEVRNGMVFDVDNADRS
ncbi:TPA: multiubiquitin domain-containing protein [Burkholderia vietnamiensis]|uniref:multiubiquitin domain-containing protein n=1 Tax=Burkholderia vietnamiensis TaxID=60552 RepID=UPI0007546C24|nr:multiubiquitin domain-containing protein [Burkholderia vietnamiensis]KVS30967.1 hypothetical protein WK34_07580 [Burkholderia vietnamiensis]MBR8012867.1 multiubiquitin domain-containing protein [Burkholderia vietnamiensis]HDR9041136.1 multiubiquitin domain-containing protein [Burkholderia vietnamiensis]HDR9196033.1 multiubiquitin domain-containing protein [Burkholderia vietnamiensis]